MKYMSKPKNTAVKDTDIDSQRRCQKGSMGHTHWEFSAPVLRAAYSTPTQHPLWAVTDHTNSWHRHSDMEVVHDYAGVKIPAMWRLLNLLTTDTTLSYWLQVHDTSALKWQPYHMKDNCYERFQLTKFWPIFTAQRVCIARTMLSLCPSSCLSVHHTPVLCRNGWRHH